MTKDGSTEEKIPYGAALHTVRVAIGLSQANISKLAGVNEQSIASLEGPRPSISMQSVAKIANALNCDTPQDMLVKEQAVETLRKEGKIKPPEHIEMLALQPRREYYISIAHKLGCENAIELLKKKQFKGKLNDKAEPPAQQQVFTAAERAQLGPFAQLALASNSSGPPSEKEEAAAPRTGADYMGSIWKTEKPEQDGGNTIAADSWADKAKDSRSRTRFRE